MKINIYTDGSSKGNPGRGGYGVIIKMKDETIELSQGYRLTTNNRMELLAVIVGLEYIQEENSLVLITSDSKYVIDSVVKGWVFNWEKKGFRKKKNQDLWKRFLVIYKKHNISFALTTQIGSINKKNISKKYILPRYDTNDFI